MFFTEKETLLSKENIVNFIPFQDDTHAQFYPTWLQSDSSFSFLNNLDNTVHHPSSIIGPRCTINPNNTWCFGWVTAFDRFFDQKPILRFSLINSHDFRSFLDLPIPNISILNRKRMHRCNKLLTKEMITNFISIILIIMCHIDHKQFHQQIRKN